MKKLFSIALTLVAVFGLVGCGSGQSPSDDDSIGADLKRAGVDPVGESKSGSMPKADAPPTAPDGDGK